MVLGFQNETRSVRPSTKQEVIRAVTGEDVRDVGPGEARHRIDQARRLHAQHLRRERRDGITAILSEANQTGANMTRRKATSLYDKTHR